MRNIYIRLPSILVGKMVQQLNLTYLSNISKKLCEKINTILPSRMDDLRNQPILMGNEIGNSPIGRFSDQQSNKIYSIPNIKEISIIASIDSSSLPIAQLELGFVLASRLSIVLSLAGGLRKYIRIGPLFHYLKEGQYGGLNDLQTRGQDPAAHARLLRYNLEQFAAQLLSSMDETCIMLDGSLAYWDLRSIEESRATYIGISKSTPLRDLRSYSGIMTKDTERGIFTKVSSQTNIGYETVYVKFEESPIFLRVDITGNNYETGYLLGLIKNNDSCLGGYPESLRLAHHLSIFTQLEIVSLKNKVLSDYTPAKIPSFSLRKAILGDAHFKGR